jgi:hypothetical protein
MRPITQPASPPSAYRLNHVCIVCRDTPTLAATSVIDNPSSITASTA